MLSVEQSSSTGHEFLMDFLVMTIQAGIIKVVKWNPADSQIPFFSLQFHKPHK